MSAPIQRVASRRQERPDPAGVLGCPRCHFAFRPRASFMTLDYCPRCLARRHVAQPLQRLAPEIAGFGLVGDDAHQGAPRAAAARAVAARSLAPS
jgi:hypothetical protein